MHRSQRALMTAALVAALASAGTLASAAEAAADELVVGVGGTIYGMDYHEFVPDPLQSNESGLITGPLAVVEVRTDVGIFVRAAGALALADTLYEGTFQDGRPLTDESRNAFAIGELDLGWNLREAIGLELLELAVLYVGLRGERWRRGIGGPAPFREIYRTIHVSVGARAEVGFGPVSLGLDGGVLPMVAGDIQFLLSDANPDRNDPIATLGLRVGGRLRALLHWRPFAALRLGLEPWYLYTAIGESEVVRVYDSGLPLRAILEPSSRTHRGGIDLIAAMVF